MRKIEKVTDFDGKEWTLFDPVIEEEYYRRILNWRDPFIHLTDENVKNKFVVYRELSNDEKVLLRAARIYKKRYLLAKPLEIQSYADKIQNDIRYTNVFYVNRASTDFTKAINEILNYDGFRDGITKGIWLAKTLNIKACPYCNAQYTLVVEHNNNNHSAKFQFDHFFPKSRYPFFCISIYNLIPSCASCNLSKKETDFNLNDYVHPYLGSFSDEFKIKLTDKSEEKYLLEKTRIEIKDIELTFVPSANVTNHDNIFNFTSVYDRHKDIVQELLHKIKFYPATRIDELAGLQSADSKPLFSDTSEIKRILYGHFADEDDINKRPLTKLMIDISENAFALKSKILKP